MMTTAMKRTVFALAALVFAAGVVMSQQKGSDGPRLYRVWSDAKGDTHLEEIDITTKGCVLIPGAVMNYSGNTSPTGSEKLRTCRSKSKFTSAYS